MLYYDNTKEYFSDCIIYKKAPNVIDEIYYNYGELQLLYNYFKTDDKELIKETYNDKKNKNILTETNIINLDKMNRQDHDNKKIVFNDLDPSHSDWSVCYFNDTTKKVFDTNIQPVLTNNKVFFNRMKDVKPICDNITDLKTDTAVNQDEDIILLQIDCNNTNIDITNNLEPENVNITKIRIVKYDKTNRTIEPYEESNEFIKYFFTLDTDTLKFMPIKRQIQFYIFKNQFCNNKYEFERSNDKCFNINQLGFESINFINNSAIFSVSQSMDDSTCVDESITTFDDVKDELKNKLLNKAKMDYKKCKQNIRSDYTDDDEIYRSRNNNCVVPNTYLLNHCRYKGCEYHNKSCNYEKDMKDINEYNDILNVDSYNDLDQEGVFYIKDNSEKHYNTCRKYINYNTDFYKKIEAIEEDKTMSDKDLIDFDTENLYTEFNLLENVSQDNCIYIFIKNIME